MARKTYNEKLHTSGDLPKIEDLTNKPESAARLGGTRMLVAPPLQYNEIMAQIPEGQLTTIDRMRALLAARAGADVTCPLTAGIFANICAHASAERDIDKIPYWRTLKTKGELNAKYPNGIDAHKSLLEEEGHTIIQKGNRFFVEAYETKLTDLSKLRAFPPKIADFSKSDRGSDFK
ncbi:MAG: MGMT family protein [Peptococcaceae bacterium]|nr:MGMT family protein [Peptococcaceae bacterium]